MKKIKKISILGSTGSIGTQTLEVVDNFKDIKVLGITGNKNIDLLEKQIRKYKPKICAVLKENLAKELKTKVNDEKTKIVCGEKGITEVTTINEVDLIVSSVSGISGLVPLMHAIKAKKNIALANKEPIVAAGKIIMREAKRNKIKILPLDSEHSAIFQCLRGNDKSKIEKIILTASGGPFYGMKKDKLKYVTKAEVLNHPRWKMGEKITVDSATLMNKGLEIIEARWLFDQQNIEAIRHKESMIHSMVQYIDGIIMAQISIAKMHYAIQYALTYPKRQQGNYERLDFNKIQSLSFGTLDEETFGCLKLCKYALKEGGLMPAILNAANEVANEKFLKGKINFLDIEKIVEDEILKNKNIPNPTIEDILNIHNEIKKKYEPF